MSIQRELKALSEILEFATVNNASDIHLKADKPPAVRIDGVLVKLPNIIETLSNEALITFIEHEDGLDVKLGKDFMDSIDTSVFRGNIRYRVNVSTHYDGVAVTLRLIPLKIPLYEELNLPKSLDKLFTKRNGLFLVTGATGSGKSTTMAAIIDYINQERACNIITIEDPVEFVYTDKKSMIIQKELNQNVSSFSKAVVSAMRQDPDIIVVGEMRDLDTIRNTLTAAETGHLVLATLHTNNCSSTFERIIDVFKPEQQLQVRLQLTKSLIGVLSQTLIPKVGGGRVPMCELMYMTNAIRSKVKNNRTLTLEEDIMQGEAEGSLDFVSSLADLRKRGLIDDKTMHEYLPEGESFQNRLRSKLGRG